MHKKAQKSLLRSVILEFSSWFESQQRPLPWRQNPDPYWVWISEIMLQQTQVQTVIPYFERFIAAFPTVHALAQAPVERVLELWSGLGYYSRARNLHKSAILLKSQGRLPNTRSEWMALPGIGPYTAGAITSIALNQPAPIVDGNVERVLSRLRQISRVPNERIYLKRIWRLSEALLLFAVHRCGIKPRVFNQALMELGATVCTPSQPSCPRCPLQPVCRAHQHQSTAQFPVPKSRPKRIVLSERVFAYLTSQGHLLVEQRPAGGWHAGLWDLPKTEIQEKGIRILYTKKIESKYVVTHHLIQRVTTLALISTPPAALKHRNWIQIDDEAQAIGAPLRKLFPHFKTAVSKLDSLA